MYYETLKKTMCRENRISIYLLLLYFKGTGQVCLPNFLDSHINACFQHNMLLTKEAKETLIPLRQIILPMMHFPC